MKKIYSSFFFLFVGLSLLFAGGTKEKSVNDSFKVKVVLPAGAPAAALSKLVYEKTQFDNSETEYEVVSGPELLQARVLSGEADIAVVPTNRASVLYSKQKNIKLLAPIVWGNLYFIPNGHPLQWVDEALYYYVNYGVDEVLNINPGTVFLGYLLYRLGVNIRFKISVFMGNDNPYAVLWTLLAARMFARDDGSTPLSGFNLSNSIDDGNLARAAAVRKELGLEDQVRIEHHITETWKSIVRQPYDRRAGLVELTKTIPNISAKHEGGNPEDEKDLAHPSDIFDYFRELNGRVIKISRS